MRTLELVTQAEENIRSFELAAAGYDALAASVLVLVGQAPTPEEAAVLTTFANTQRTLANTYRACARRLFEELERLHARASLERIELERKTAS